MIIDGAEYSEDELDVLRIYAGRKPKKTVPYRSLVNEAVHYQENGNREINTFLGSGGKSMPDSLFNGKQLREFIERIETLFGIACKYGATHIIPNVLYREENQPQDFMPSEETGQAVVSTSFKSCSTNESETEVFKTRDSKTLRLTSSSEFNVKKIPFINVNALLGSDSVYSDEKEIIIPPYLLMYLNEDESRLSEDESKDAVSVELSSQMCAPLYGDKENGLHTLERFDSESDYITDEELDLIIKLSYRNRFNGGIPEEQKAQLDELLSKMRNYMMTRCKTIYSLYMESPLIIGGKTSASRANELSGIGHIPDVQRRDLFFTESDVFEYFLQGGNVLDDLEVVPDEEFRINSDLVSSVLNAGIETEKAQSQNLDRAENSEVGEKTLTKAKVSSLAKQNDVAMEFENAEGIMQEIDHAMEHQNGDDSITLE